MILMTSRSKKYGFSITWTRSQKKKKSKYSTKYDIDERTIRKAIRASASTTYLNWKGEKFDWMEYCISDRTFYYFNLKLMEFVDYRPYFHGKFVESDFTFFLDQLELGIKEETKLSDEIWIRIFKFAMEDLIKTDYSPFSHENKRKIITHFFEFTYRLMNVGTDKSCDELVSKECSLILKSFKRDYGLAYTIQKSGVDERKKIIKGEEPFIVKKDGEIVHKSLPCETGDCHHFVFKFILEECNIISKNGKAKNFVYREAILCVTNFMQKNNVHRCPRVDYGFFDITLATSPCEQCFGRMGNRFPKGKHKGLCNYDGDVAINFLSCAHCQAKVIREEEKKRGIDISPEVFWHLGNPNNFWGGIDVTFEEFLIIRKDEFVKGYKNHDEWCVPWMKWRSHDIPLNQRD